MLGLWPSPTLRFAGGARSAEQSPLAILLGRTATGAKFGLPIEPGQGRHALFLGETGMGKSSALLRTAVRASELGGLVFFDPIGDTSRRLLDRLPTRALDRVVWISPALSPVGLNALASASRPGVGGERALNDLVAALRRVRAGRYADSPFWGPRVDEMVTLALRAAAAFPDGTLRDADSILASVGGRLTGVPPAAEQPVRELLDRVRARPEEVDGARRVVGEVVRTPVLARMLAARSSSFSIGEALRDGRIVLVTGDAPEVGESTARVLLSVLLALLWGELLAGRRAGKTFVIADELQFYANDSVGELLRLGRRFNVHLFAATQSLASLTDPIREALVTNVADVVAFRGSPDDARELARWVADVPVESILALRRGEAVALVGKGSEVGWVRLPFDPDRPRPDRWRTAWEGSRPLWAPAEEPPSDGPRAPSEGGGGSVESDPVREVLLVLWAAVLSSGPEPSVSVRLDDLRDELRAEEATVRLTGQRLSHAGALTATDEGSSRKWTVRRDALAPLLGSGVAPGELARADAHWARLRQRSVKPVSRKQL
ncbi:MAG TPA: hypothetical protein VGP88_08600 [Thermoplasmata archaeon]|nr:hypothetical protein [Thermoplasmata archaeon]